jgi:hypothetical protein
MASSNITSTMDAVGCLALLPSCGFQFYSFEYDGRIHLQLTSILEHLVNVCLLGTFFSLLLKIGLQNTKLHYITGTVICCWVLKFSFNRA